jgi:hypothetical protein
MVRDSERAPLAGPATEKRKGKILDEVQQRTNAICLLICLFLTFTLLLLCVFVKRKGFLSANIFLGLQNQLYLTVFLPRQGRPCFFFYSQQSYEKFCFTILLNPNLFDSLCFRFLREQIENLLSFLLNPTLVSFIF